MTNYTILSTPRGTPKQCADAILARKHGEYTEHDIRNVIVPKYFSVCRDAAIDPVFVLAQVIHETENFASWWAARPRRNPAGLGVTGDSATYCKNPNTYFLNPQGRWVQGLAFASWDRSSEAHVGRLLAYCLKDEHATPHQMTLIKQALLVHPLPIAYRGCARYWTDLNGRWADPGPIYGQKIAEVAITRILRATPAS